MKKIISLFLSIFFYSVFLFADKPIVRDLQTIPGKNSRINIIWTLPKSTEEPVTELRLYRSKKQISEYSQIKNMQPIAVLDAEATGYTDNLPDLSNYFYAVILCSPEPYDLILTSVNATAKGTQLKTQKASSAAKKEKSKKTISEGNARETPLPYIDFIDKPGTSKISKKAAASAKQLAEKTAFEKNRLDPFYFEEDLISPDSGDDYFLFQILKTTFAPRKYEEAIPQLQQLIGTKIDDSTQNRAIFYLGESYYLLGNYEEAVRTFVKLQNEYPVLTKKWIDASLDNI